MIDEQMGAKNETQNPPIRPDEAMFVVVEEMNLDLAVGAMSG